MSEFNLKPGWGSHSFLMGQMYFHGEAAGARESELKKKFTQVFQNDFRVKRAYLAQTQFVSSARMSTMLCLKVIYGGEDVKLIEQLANIYAALFDREERMTMAFLKEGQEEQLAEVCPPFYSKYAMDADLMVDGLPLTGVICPHCASGSRPILLAQRTSPHEKGDSGWQFYCKSGVEEDIAEAKVMPLKEIIKLEPSLRNWLETPIGTNLWRAMGRSRWEQIKEEKNGHGPNGNGLNGHGHNGESNNIGNGMFSPNGEVNFVRESGKLFDRGVTPPAPAESKPEDADPVREYIKLRAGWPHPVEIALYYECLGCGEILSSGSEGKCRCGNIAISSGVVKIDNLAKASAFRQR